MEKEPYSAAPFRLAVVRGGVSFLFHAMSSSSKTGRVRNDKPVDEVPHLSCPKILRIYPSIFLNVSSSMIATPSAVASPSLLPASEPASR